MGVPGMNQEHPRLGNAFSSNVCPLPDPCSACRAAPARTAFSADALGLALLGQTGASHDVQRPWHPLWFRIQPLWQAGLILHPLIM